MLGEWLPHIGSIADDICVVRSMVTDQINHAPAMTKFLTGHQLPGRPSFGCWASYGLGSVNSNFPDYVVLLSKMKRSAVISHCTTIIGEVGFCLPNIKVSNFAVPKIPCFTSTIPKDSLARFVATCLTVWPR